MVGVPVVVGVGVRVPVWVAVGDWVTVGIVVEVTVGCGELVDVQLGVGEGVGEEDGFESKLQEVRKYTPANTASPNQPLPGVAKAGSDLSRSGDGLLQRFIFTPFIIVNDAGWEILH